MTEKGKNSDKDPPLSTSFFRAYFISLLNFPGLSVQKI